MQAKDIHISDWMRILVGDVPMGFFVELLIRAVFVYLILMISMRLMGKRMSSQLGRNELAALVSLAAAIGIPMMAPDRGLLPAVVIAFVLIAIERMIAKRSTQSKNFESYVQGDLSTLICDGVIDIKELKRVKLSRERVLAQLRSAGVFHLGEISRFYMEASGTFTLVRQPQASPGLSVLPPWDIPLRDCFIEHSEIICGECGLQQKVGGNPGPKCRNCGKDKWTAAVEKAE